MRIHIPFYRYPRPIRLPKPIVNSGSLYNSHGVPVGLRSLNESAHK